MCKCNYTERVGLQRPGRALPVPWKGAAFQPEPKFLLLQQEMLQDHKPSLLLRRKIARSEQPGRLLPAGPRGSRGTLICRPELRLHPDLGDGSGTDTRNEGRALKISKGRADAGPQHPYEETPTGHPRACRCPGTAQELGERGCCSLSPFLPREAIPDLSQLPFPSLSGCPLLGECFCTLSLPLPQDYFFGSGSLIFPARRLLHRGTELLAALP